MHPSLARVQVKGSLGRDPEEIFKHFTPEPFAAASLGQVHHAVSREGQRLAEELRPSVILLDVMIPSRDGWDMLIALKAVSAVNFDGGGATAFYWLPASQTSVPTVSAAAIVVPEPAKASSTTDPRCEQSRMTSTTKATGFTVGCIFRSSIRPALNALAPG